MVTSKCTLLLHVQYYFIIRKICVLTFLLCSVTLISVSYNYTISNKGSLTLNYLACVSLWLLSLRRGFLIKYRVTQMPLYVEVWLCNNKAPDDEMS